MSTTVFASVADFYRERGGETSGECDFGVWWYTPRPFETSHHGPYYRVSVVHDTGDIYALNQWDHRVELLTTLPAIVQVCDRINHHLSDCPYKQAENYLEGWAEGASKPLSWARERLP